MGGCVGTESVESGTGSVNKTSVDEHRRFLIQIVMLLRVDMRTLFGVEESNRWGFFVDMHLSRKVHEFAQWLDYPKGDRVLKDESRINVRSVAISGCGHFFFTGSENGSMRAWNMLNHKIVREWQAHAESVDTMAFRSGLLISGALDKSIKIWGTNRDYQLVHTLEGHSDWVLGVDINNDATQVVSGSKDNSIRIWSVKTGECIRVLMGHSQSVTSVKFIGDRILSGSGDKSLKVWNQSDGSVIQSVNEGIDGKIYDVSINCDSSLIACTFDDGFSLYTWPELKFIHKIDGFFYRCAFHPIHSTILAVSDYYIHSITLFDLTNYEIIRTFKGDSHFINDLCFTPDGTRFGSVFNDRSVRIWDVSDV